MSRARAPRRPLPILAPLGRAALAAAHFRNLLFDRGWLRAQSVPLPIACVGNLTAGGTGKTPVVLWLLERLWERGEAVGVVSRGYGGERDEEPLVVSRGAKILAPPGASGDEAALVARRGLAHVVVVGVDRVEAARRAAAEGATIAVLDDGLQHRRLRRDADLVLCDHRDPLGGGRGIPAGLLREPPSDGLKRAAAVLLTRAPAGLAARTGALAQEHIPPALREVIGTIPERLRPPVFAASYPPSGIRDPTGNVLDPDGLGNAPVLLVSGIAQPASFASSASATGVRIADHLVFADHHPYSEADGETIASRARALDAIVLTTEKDAVRWPESAPLPHVLVATLAIGAELALLEIVTARLQRARESAR